MMTSVGFFVWSRCGIPWYTISIHLHIYSLLNRKFLAFFGNQPVAKGHDGGEFHQRNGDFDPEVRVFVRVNKTVPVTNK